MPEVKAMTSSLLLLSACALIACATCASAGTYYVAPNGSDGNEGSAASPFATIQKAADAVNPGDVVIVKDGVYTQADSEGYGVQVDRSGTSDHPITFRF